MREQMKIIREELGEGEDENEFENYKAKIHELHLNEEHEMKLFKDVDRLKKQPFGSSEAAVLRNYLDVVLDLPWNIKTKERVDVAAARKILEHDHWSGEGKRADSGNHCGPTDRAGNASTDQLPCGTSRRWQDFYFLLYCKKSEP